MLPCAPCAPASRLFRIGGDEFAVVVAGGADAGGRCVRAHPAARSRRRRAAAACRPSPPASRRTRTTRRSEDELLRPRRHRALRGQAGGKYRGPAAGPRAARVAGEREVGRPLPPRPASALTRPARRRRPELLDAPANDASRSSTSRSRRRRTAAAARAAIAAMPARRRRARRRPAGHRRALLLPPAEERSRDARTSASSCSTGADAVEEAARRAGADALLRKPFSPLELLGVVERLAGGLEEGPFDARQRARRERAAAPLRAATSAACSRSSAAARRCCSARIARR